MADDPNKSKQAQVIDDNLKRVYRDMLDEKVPDRFLDLLAQLKTQTGPIDTDDTAETGEDVDDR